MRENILSKPGRVVVTIALLFIGFFTIKNIVNFSVPNPLMFLISIVGFMLFLISKFSIIREGDFVTFGASKMTSSMANLYRLGYWLIVVGVIGAFFG